MENGESLLDATMRLTAEVRQKITHFQRNVNIGDDCFKVEPVLPVDDEFGHGDDSLCTLISDLQSNRKKLFEEAIDDCYLDNIIANALDYREILEANGGRVADLYCEGNELLLSGNEPYWLVQMLDHHNARYCEQKIHLADIVASQLCESMLAIQIPISSTGYEAGSNDDDQSILLTRPFNGVQIIVRPALKTVRLAAHLYSRQRENLVHRFCAEANSTNYIIKVFYTEVTEASGTYSINFVYDYLVLDQLGVGMHTLAKATLEFVFSVAALADSCEYLSLDVE